MHLSGQVHAEPLGQFRFADAAGGYSFHEPDRVYGPKPQDFAAIGRKVFL